MRRRDFVVAAPALILVGCKNMDAGGAMSAVGDLAKAASLTDAEVSGYAAQMVAAQDKQAKILGASSKYGQRMAKLTSGLQSFDGLKLDFKVYDSNQINAFACPNGAIRFYSGLMDAMTDDEIRYVIGHEIGHIKLGHSKSRMQTALATSAAQSNENAADDYAVQTFLTKIGSNKKGAVTALEKLAAMSGGGGGWTSTHPAPKERAERMKKLIG